MTGVTHITNQNIAFTDVQRHKHYTMGLHDGDHQFKESIVVDEDDGIVTYEVPPHGDRDGMTFFVHSSTVSFLQQLEISVSLVSLSYQTLCSLCNTTVTVLLLH